MNFDNDSVHRRDKTRSRISLNGISLVLWVCAAVLILFILVPTVSIFLELWGGDIMAGITSNTTLSALRLSLMTTTLSLLLMMAIGTPTAYKLAHSNARGRRLVDSIIDLPIVMPPSVAGIALLLAFAPRSPIGMFLSDYGLIIPGSIFAVILAQTFVALPFFVRSARTAFEEINPRLEMAATILSPSRLFTFKAAILPLASRGLVAGAILGWGRALGEFGATLMFAGNIPGITQTMPLAIYFALSQDLYSSSFISAILIIISFMIIFGLRVLEPRSRR